SPRASSGRRRWSHASPPGRALHRGGCAQRGHHPTSSLPTFFFQAEDGIRDRNVTGVQTCALTRYWRIFTCVRPSPTRYIAPIWSILYSFPVPMWKAVEYRPYRCNTLQLSGSYVAHQFNPPSVLERSEDVTIYNADDSRARQLLDAAGYDGEPIEFWYPTDTERVYMTQPQKLFSYLSGRLSAVGLNIIAKPISWNAGGYLAQIMDNDGDRGLH